MRAISEETTDKFNEILREQGSIIKLYNRYNAIDIKLVEDDFLDMENQIIAPSKDFYDLLEKFFKKEGHKKISYNNTGSCFWSI
jgi:phage antirepressor YoqD-like protein